MTWYAHNIVHNKLASGNLITVSMTIPKKLKDRTHSLLKYRFTRSTSSSNYILTTSEPSCWFCPGHLYHQIGQVLLVTSKASGLRQTGLLILVLLVGMLTIARLFHPITMIGYWWDLNIFHTIIKTSPQAKRHKTSLLFTSLTIITFITRYFSSLDNFHH